MSLRPKVSALFSPKVAGIKPLSNVVGGLFSSGPGVPGLFSSGLLLSSGAGILETGISFFGSLFNSKAHTKYLQRLNNELGSIVSSYDGSLEVSNSILKQLYGKMNYEIVNDPKQKVVPFWKAPIDKIEQSLKADGYTVQKTLTASIPNQIGNYSYPVYGSSIFNTINGSKNSSVFGSSSVLANVQKSGFSKYLMYGFGIYVLLKIIKR